MRDRAIATARSGYARRVPRRRLLVVMALVLLALSAWALVAGSTIPPQLGDLDPQAVRSDETLYETIAERVRDGDSYYTAAVEEQRSAGYPTSPAMTIRPPATTWVVAYLGPAAPWVLRSLVLLAAVATMLRLEHVAPTRAEWFAGSLLAAASLGVFAHPRAVVLAEAWCACLLVLSLALHGLGRRRWAVVVGLAAVLFRELAVPYLVVMAVLAWRRDRREAAGWLMATGVFVLAYAAHVVAATEAASGASAISSPSWLAFGGWPYVVDTFGFASVLRPLPFGVWVVLLALSLWGWAARLEDDHARRVLAVCAVFLAIFLVAGRPDTAYWGRLYVAWLLPGLAFAPRAVALALRPRVERMSTSRH